VNRSPRESQTFPAILFEDPHLIVLSKPAGFLSQGEKKGDANVVDWLRGYLGRHYVGLVHRLDRNVSGVMVAAKRTKAARRLTEALCSDQMSRVYRGWLAGKLSRKARWSHTLLKDEETNLTRVVSSRHPKGKAAVLSVRPLGYGRWEGMDLTLAEFELETGRSHQIRAQAAAEGFPILGDEKYGGPGRRALNKKFGRPALHSFRIRFPHPMTGETLVFEAELPEDMQRIPCTTLR